MTRRYNLTNSSVGRRAYRRTRHYRIQATRVRRGGDRPVDFLRYPERGNVPCILHRRNNCRPSARTVPCWPVVLEGVGCRVCWRHDSLFQLVLRSLCHLPHAVPEARRRFLRPSLLRLRAGRTTYSKSARIFLWLDLARAALVIARQLARPRIPSNLTTLVSALREHGCFGSFLFGGLRLLAHSLAGLCFAQCACSCILSLAAFTALRRDAGNVGTVLWL